MTNEAIFESVHKYMKLSKIFKSIWFICFNESLANHIVNIPVFSKTCIWFFVYTFVLICRDLCRERAYIGFSLLPNPIHVMNKIFLTKYPFIMVISEEPWHSDLSPSSGATLNIWTLAFIHINWIFLPGLNGTESFKSNRDGSIICQNCLNDWYTQKSVNTDFLM